jgi:hypothetical protein
VAGDLGRRRQLTAPAGETHVEVADLLLKK